MRLTMREQEKLMVFVAAQVARKRLEKGLKLNYPESVAIITDEIMEGAREGKMVEQLMDECRNILKRDQVMEGYQRWFTLFKLNVHFQMEQNL